jgi:hypothetical protein
MWLSPALSALYIRLDFDSQSMNADAHGCRSSGCNKTLLGSPALRLTNFDGGLALFLRVVKKLSITALSQQLTLRLMLNTIPASAAIF